MGYGKENFLGRPFEPVLPEMPLAIDVTIDLL
jgi:hypothetical protein